MQNKKIISFVIFKDCPDWLFKYYERGIDYNNRMAKIIFKDWQFQIKYIHQNISRCEAMLLRLKPLYDDNVERVICRDLDAILTYRDFKSVERWIESDTIAHGMNDNPAHGGLPLMGGMCGFKAESFKNIFPSWEQLISNFDLSKHGSDQKLLMERVFPKIRHSFYFDRTPEYYPYSGIAESDLTCRHIGSAGVVEMELERFFKKYE